VNGDYERLGLGKSDDSPGILNSCNDYFSKLLNG
jgi:hypothetical protein